MNSKELLNKLKHYLEVLKTSFRSVREIPHSGKYFILAIVLTLIFTVLTFPYDYLIKKQLFDSEGKTLKSFSVQKLDFNIIGESGIDNIELILNTGQEISCKNIIINPSVNPYRLFVSQRYKADFQFDALKYISGDLEILLNLNGNIDIIMNKIKKIPGSGEMKLIISDARLKMNEISIPGPMGPLPLKLDSVNIQNGLSEIDIVNGIARIKNFKLTGTDLNCTITGTMELAERTANTKLDLTVNIDPESQVFEQYKDLITAVTKNGPLILAVRGTFSHPDIKMAGTEKAQ